MPKRLLFSVTADDCDWQTMTAGGPGGQHQNRTQSAVRCTHRASGAVGVSREFKSQIQNKRAAFTRMCESSKFKSWHRLETARRLLNEQSIETMVAKAVDEQMRPHNLRLEVQDARGRWALATANTLET